MIVDNDPFPLFANFTEGEREALVEQRQVGRFVVRRGDDGDQWQAPFSDATTLSMSSGVS